MTPLRVLLVEDEPTIAMLLARVLRNQGHEVCAVATSEAGAIAAAALHHPQIILVDVRLRPGSGVAAMTAILQHGFVPHVFTSGTVIDGLAPEVILLKKPFTEPELAVALQCAMAMRPPRVA